MAAVASQAAVLDVAWRAVAGPDDARRPEVFGGNAARVYVLADPGG
jgi:hypothetical protein